MSHPLNFSFLLVGFLLLSCKNDIKYNERVSELSKTQRSLNSLKEKYEFEYYSTNSALSRGKIKNKYEQLLQSFLMDTLKQQIDSIKVTVDTVVTKRITILTRFHSNQIGFEYSLNLTDTSEKIGHSLYYFMTGLKKGVDTTVNFFYMGSSRVNEPKNKDVQIFRIFGFPKPLKVE